jgi:hypothetical protein
MASQRDNRDRSILPPPDPPFPGEINVALTDSRADFPEPLRAPDGAPNVLIVVGDDIGYGHMDAFGGPARTPTFDRLATRGHAASCASASPRQAGDVNQAFSESSVAHWMRASWPPSPAGTNPCGTATWTAPSSSPQASGVPGGTARPQQQQQPGTSARLLPRFVSDHPGRRHRRRFRGFAKTPVVRAGSPAARRATTLCVR